MIPLVVSSNRQDTTPSCASVPKRKFPGTFQVEMDFLWFSGDRPGDLNTKRCKVSESSLTRPKIG